MSGKTVFAALILALSAGGAGAQGKVQTTTSDDIYCSGVISTEKVPEDTFLTTGEGSNYKITFQQGDYVYINKGASQGVKVGDEFSVIRPVLESVNEEWSKWQFSIMKKLGTVWEDEGQVKVVVAQPNVSIAQIEHSCNYMQRGDIVMPFTERPLPPIKSEENFDRFAPPSGKPVAMIITGKLFQVQYGTNDVIYVNLGVDQGVKVGDYFRIFRYAGTEYETAYQTPRFAFDADGFLGLRGFGSVPSRYRWDNTPREVLGEGVVVRTSPNSSTVLVRLALREVFIGDYVEIE